MTCLLHSRWRRDRQVGGRPLLQWPMLQARDNDLPLSNREDSDVDRGGTGGLIQRSHSCRCIHAVTDLATFGNLTKHLSGFYVTSIADCHASKRINGTGPKRYFAKFYEQQLYDCWSYYDPGPMPSTFVGQCPFVGKTSQAFRCVWLVIPGPGNDRELKFSTTSYTS